jgi:hypothetical protein
MHIVSEGEILSRIATQKVILMGKIADEVSA